MLLAQIVETSRRVSQTTKRLEKADLLAQLLRRAPPEESEIAVAWLSGYTLQGKIGVGFRTLQAASAEPAETATLQVGDVNRRRKALSEVSGSGSEGRRRELVRELLAEATAPEQEFLIALLTGELRQGALEGLMVEGV